MLVHFEPKTALARDLQACVDAFLAAQDPAPIRRRMIAKTVSIWAWTLASYLALLFGPTHPAWVFVAATSLGLAMAGIGFAVMHDANHDAYPVSKGWRRAIGFSLDVMGGSSYLWRFQHNINHHSFTNVAGADNDIQIGILARLSPAQPRLRLHRFQHVYLWPFYSLLAVSWMFWADWRDYFRGAIGDNTFPRPKRKEAFLFWLGKAIWLTLLLVVPLASGIGLGSIAIVALWTYLVLGFTLSIVFQLAHIVDAVEFPILEGDPAPAGRDFFTHQLATTANFAPDDAFMNWYLGGLNHQVEHHLFPRVCHLHYPALAPLVQEICARHGAPYHSYETFGAALVAHARCLKQQGQPDARTATAPVTA